MGPPYSLVARAKVNLTLEVKGKRDDGYHEIESFVMFADFGDVLHCHASPNFSLSIDGPFAERLGGGDNLIKKAWELFQSGIQPHEPVVEPGRLCVEKNHWPNQQIRDGASTLSGAHFHLDKQIPVAAGLGGGSADAAAALRLLHAISPDVLNMDKLSPLARSIGADVAVCLYSHPCIMTGIGDQIHDLASPPEPIHAVLVNPLQPLSTAAVFHELAAQPLAVRSRSQYPAIPRLSSFDDIISYTRPRSNDLTAPACRLMPVIGEILHELESLAETVLARLSGSGPSCFALCRDEAAAAKLAGLIADAHPNWWVKRTALY